MKEFEIEKRAVVASALAEASENLKKVRQKVADQYNKKLEEHMKQVQEQNGNELSSIKKKQWVSKRVSFTVFVTKMKLLVHDKTTP